MNGCCYGRVCSLPWGVQFPHLPEPVHPTQLYEAFYNFFLFFFLYRLYTKKKFTGQVTILYFMFYAVGRFMIEFWRADNPMLNVLTWNQWLSAGIFFAGALCYVWTRRQRS